MKTSITKLVALILYLPYSVTASVVTNFNVGASGSSEFMSHTSYAQRIESSVYATSVEGEKEAIGNKYLEHSYVDWGVFASGASELLVHAKQIISPERIVLSSYSQASLFMHTTNNLGGDVHVYGLISGEISFLDQSQNFSILAVRSLLCEGLCSGFEPEHSRQYLEGYGNQATIYTGNNKWGGMFIEGQHFNQDGLLRMYQKVEVTINYGIGATQNNPIQASSTTNNSTTTQLRNL